jgi:hypothetical protein
MSKEYVVYDGLNDKIYVVKEHTHNMLIYCIHNVKFIVMLGEL